MNKLLIAFIFIFLVLTSCVENYTSINYLKQVEKRMKEIKSATFWVRSENWNPGDTAASDVYIRYVESYRNPSDTTIGSSWAIFKTEDKSQLEFAYDGKMRVIIYEAEKIMVIDSFKIRKLPFRPVMPPFFNYTENIIKYILENNDSTLLIQEDLGEEIYLKVTIYEDRQVEFFGRAHYIPKNPYTFDPTSIYELWIDKKSNLPKKVRREMSHNISISSVLNYEFNKLSLEDFVVSDYFPKNYEIRQYGQKGKKRKTNELVGKKAPDWTLRNDDKQNISLSDLKSKVLMLQFTSISCGPCKASIPFLKELSTEYTNTDFDFVAIECTSKNTNALKSYMNRNHFNYKLLLSTKEVLKKYSITSFPVFIILDENRYVKKVINGYKKEKTDEEIRSLINEMI